MVRRYTSPITSISGTAEANSTVEVFDNGNTLGTTDADNTGAWSLTGLTLGEGSHSLTATATDEAGNTGPASDAVVVVVDLTAPDAPVIMIQQLVRRSLSYNLNIRYCRSKLYSRGI